MSSLETDWSPGRDLTTVSVTPYPGVDVVSVIGDFDMRYESFVKCIVTDPTRVNQSQVVLDLSRVPFMDARGVGAIVYCKGILAERSAELSLVCPEGSARRVLRLLDFERVVAVYPDRETALLQVSDGRHPLNGRRRSGHELPHSG
jgi:anti-anti-sigma factor